MGKRIVFPIVLLGGPGVHVARHVVSLALVLGTQTNIVTDLLRKGGMSGILSPCALVHALTTRRSLILPHHYDFEHPGCCLKNLNWVRPSFKLLLLIWRVNAGARSWSPWDRIYAKLEHPQAALHRATETWVESILTLHWFYLSLRTHMMGMVSMTYLRLWRLKSEWLVSWQQWSSITIEALSNWSTLSRSTTPIQVHAGSYQLLSWTELTLRASALSITQFGGYGECECHSDNSIYSGTWSSLWIP